MNYKSFNLGDWIGHISGAIEDERELDGNEMRDLVEFLTTSNKEPIIDKIRAEIEQIKSIMNEEIINNNRKDLINFVNGLNQSLVIVDKYKSESVARAEIEGEE